MDRLIRRTALDFVEELMERGVYFAMNPLYDGYQWRFGGNLENGDVAIHHGTYGNQNRKVESYGMPWDNDDVSALSPEEMAMLIANSLEEDA